MSIISLVPYTIFPAKVGGQKGIALFNLYLSKVTTLLCITVKSNDPKHAATYQVLNILPNAASRYINPQIYFLIKRIIKRKGSTHLVLEHPYYGWLGILLKKFTGIKLVVHSHNIESLRWKSLGKWWWKILWWYERATHLNADYNFFIHDADKDYAVSRFKLDEKKCTVITYGIEIETTPSLEDKQACKSRICQLHGISHSTTIFLFNGALDYSPNREAVINIVNNINPHLLSSGLSYKIIICGRGLPEELNSLKDYADKNIIYAGFVDDISVYFKGADIFINPVVEGGGIKTKMVEALGYNTKVISTQNGSIGVKESETSGQLIIVPDNDWKEFSQQMIISSNIRGTMIPASFYQKFYWGNIARKAAAFIGS